MINYEFDMSINMHTFELENQSWFKMSKGWYLRKLWFLNCLELKVFKCFWNYLWNMVWFCSWWWFVWYFCWSIFAQAKIKRGLKPYSLQYLRSSEWFFVQTKIKLKIILFSLKPMSFRISENETTSQPIF